jgi:soluble lytic murein transglycosylase-like protein
VTNGPRSATQAPAGFLARVRALPRSRPVIGWINCAAFGVGTLGVLAVGVLSLSAAPSPEVPVASTTPAAPVASAEPAVFRPLVAGTPVPAALTARRPSATEALILDTFGPLGPQAIAVARCESSLDPQAISDGGGNYGLFQINRLAHEAWLSSLGYSFEQLLDPQLNVLVARAIYQRAGSWEPWECDWAATT